MKNLKGGEAMERKEMQTTPAGRVSQQTKTLKGVVLGPDEAIAFSKTQWLKLLKNLHKKLPDGLCISRNSEYHMCITFTEDKRLPFAKIIIATVEQEKKDIKRNERWKKAVIEALKKNKAFMRVLKKNGGAGSLYWIHELWSSEVEYTKGKSYPVFFALLNNSNLSTTINL
jgi:hypothetical protein